ncbi:MAG: hypothetical protein AAFY02_16360 [Pseudomonadota bacterium]
MDSAPIDSWEGAEVIFTFADNPFAIGLFLVLMVAVIVGVIGASAKHENESFRKAEKGE